MVSTTIQLMRFPAVVCNKRPQEIALISLPTQSLTSRPFALTSPTEACPDGTHTWGDLATDHDSIDDCFSICEAGKELKDGALECSPCMLGHYKAETRMALPGQPQPPCRICEIGRYADVEGASECRVCPAGASTNEVEEGASECSVCPAGTIATSEASTSCANCASGTYLVDDGQDATRHNSTTDCALCSVGTFSSVEGRTTPCDTCGAGKVAAAEGSTECALCAIGRYLADDATDPAEHDNQELDCVDCQPGLMSSDDRSECRPCPPGTELSQNATT